MPFSADAIVGAIAGGAIGDVVGGISERGSSCLSDDTQLTLATCESFLERGAIFPEAVAAAMLRWFRARSIVGIGASTLKALRDLDVGAHWALSGARGEMAAGNGAAMRVAPLAFVLDPHSPLDRVTIRDVCRITHHSDEAYVGALAVAVALHASPFADHFLRSIREALPDSRVRDRLTEFEQLPGSISVDEIAASFGASGYVVETVPLSLLVVARMMRSGFSDSLEEASKILGDTDTICSIAGQIAGAHLGASQLPARLLELQPLAQVLPTAKSFAAAASSSR